MAERRMFSKQIIDSDLFLDMPLSTQALYFHLSMRADDDGFINNPKKLMRMIGAADDDMRILIARKFILSFDTGVVVVRHWRIHNYIRKDMYHSTVCTSEMAQISEATSGEYVYSVTTTLQSCNEPVTNSSREVSIGKDSIVQVSTKGNTRGVARPEKRTYGEGGNVRLTDDEYERLKAKYPDADDRINALDLYIGSKGDKYKSHYMTILNWDRMHKEKDGAKGSGNVFIDLMRKESMNEQAGSGTDTRAVAGGVSAGDAGTDRGGSGRNGSIVGFTVQEYTG